MAAGSRWTFLDVLRGAALIFMVVNHTARWWIDRSMGWGRYWLVYASMAIAAPIFLFLAGFVLPLALGRRAGSPGRVFLGLARRGAEIVAAGWLLNVLVFPEDAWYAGGVLQTIGLSLILLAALAPLVRTRWGRAALAVGAVAVYWLFVVAYPALREWVAAHPAVSKVVFLDYAPWPWTALVALGFVAGDIWHGAAAAGAERGYFRRAAGLGLALMAIAAALEWSRPSAMLVGFQRDLMLNHHWVPAPVTTLFVLGMVLAVLALFWWLCEVRGLRAGWLVTLGRTALMLYVAHQVIALTILSKWLGVAFHAWWAYWLANAALIAVLVALAHAWLALKARVRRPARAVRGAETA